MFWNKDSFRIKYNAPNFFIKNIGLLLSVAVLLATFFIGFYAGKKVEISKTSRIEIQNLINKDAKPEFAIGKSVDFNLFWNVWNKIKQDYVEQPVDEVKMFYGAIAGMVGSLDDPYSVFFEPKIAEELKKMEYEPLLPIEKKLIIGSIALGLILLLILVFVSHEFFPTVG